MHKYSYNGPVLVFGKLAINNFKTETTAVSEPQARAHFIHQAKRKLNLVSNSKVELPGKIKFLY